jgi:proline dehydrogenase
MGLFSRLIVNTMPLVPRFVVHRVASRYVAGETMAEALATVKDLNARGAMATLDVLGEEVTERQKAEEGIEEYLRLLDAIHEQGLDANISVKPTMLGLKIDEGFCRDNIERLVAAAAERGNFVRIDMEDRTTTDATLDLYKTLLERHGHVGTVLQAYMRRTLDDIGALPEKGANIRLCKGIYVEPEADAWKGYDTVRQNFVAALDKLFRQGVYVGIATHDEYLLCAAEGLVDRHGLQREQYEFQMLLGVTETLRDILLDRGHRLRVYVPYGPDWYPYSKRRMRENPEIATHVIKATLLGR